ncbi:MAG: TetR/AcrR family transcriptional regulator [Sulfobacillus benefaciens]|uniref:TetR/AcrR family transcriptional regulator n=1 Tax=Sulfobacillus benefaciens TaxID=453960 RepID=A0A2T2WTW0_9FIRM|nr:MAG: TetR/AcrR family transcriptional regulator [Sulfobacillus benefaciens]
MKTSTNTRQHLAATAAQLFYSTGITASGVDAIVSHAGVSKPTLYSYYHSKSELVAAALRFQHETRKAMIETYLEERHHDKPEDRLMAVFDWLEEWSRERGNRGCAFINAAVELVQAQDEPARQIIRRHKEWWQTLLRDLARNAGAKNPESLAEDLLLLIEGVNARVLITGNSSSVASARKIAGLLLRESQSER